jgi:hypothetical protein
LLVTSPEGIVPEQVDEVDGPLWRNDDAVAPQDAVPLENHQKPAKIDMEWVEPIKIDVGTARSDQDLQEAKWREQFVKQPKRASEELGSILLRTKRR